MAVSLTWSSSTAAQSSSGLALVTGDTLTQTSWQGLVSNVYLLSQLAQGPGQLIYVSTTQIKFKIVNGAVIRINRTMYNLTADITAANTSTYIDGVSGNLATSTVYYVYAFISTGTTVSLTFSTTAYAIDTTAGNVGTYTKNGNTAYTLVGMIRTNGSSQFVDQSNQRFTRSWFNDQGVAIENQFSSNATTTNTTPYAEVSSSYRAEFLSWTGEKVIAGVSGNLISSASVQVHASLGFNGATGQDGSNLDLVNTGPNGLGYTVVKTGLTEGYNYATVIGYGGNSNTVTWIGSASVGERISISGIIQRG